MIQQLKQEYPVKAVCTALDCPASSSYYVPVVKDEREVIAAAEQVLLRFPFYGYRKLSKALTRQGHSVGEHVARRLLSQLGMSRAVGKIRVQTTDSNHGHPRYPNHIKGMTLKSPDQVWVGDITYIRLGTRFIYLAVILDAFTRAVRGWSLSRTLAQSMTLEALNMALTSGHCPFIFHSDQGSQYAAWLHTERLLENNIRISMSDKARPQQNGIVERFMRTLKEEHVDYTEYENFDDACRQVKHWLEVTYMTERLHQSLDYATPAEFELAVLARPRYPLLSPV
jgi:putative transposase